MAIFLYVVSPNLSFHHCPQEGILWPFLLCGTVSTHGLPNAEIDCDNNALKPSVASSSV